MMKLSKMSKSNERGPGTRGSRFIPIGMLAGPAGSIVTGILKNWKIVLFGILISIIVYQNTVSFELLRPFGVRTIPGITQEYDKKLTEAEDKVRIAQEQVIECDMSRQRLKGAIEATNDQVEKWSKLSQSLQNDQTKLSSKLAELAKQTDTEIQVILEGPAPQTCEGAIKLLRTAVTSGDLKW